MINKLKTGNIVAFLTFIFISFPYLFSQETNQKLSANFYIEKNNGTSLDLSKGSQSISSTENLLIKLTSDKKYRIETVSIFAELHPSKKQFTDLKKIWKVYRNQDMAFNNSFSIPVNRMVADFYKLSIKITSIKDSKGNQVTNISPNRIFEIYITYKR